MKVNILLVVERGHIMVIEVGGVFPVMSTIFDDITSTLLPQWPLPTTFTGSVPNDILSLL